MTKESVDINELRDEVEYLVLERESLLRLHELKIGAGTLETVLTAGASVIENVAKLKLSSAVKALFTASHKRIELLEAEQMAPGKEIAYITRLRRKFG